ncbi:MAG: HAMP domain-containing sensor histidine kinase [Bacillota bacterium]
MKEIVHLGFLKRIEKRIFKPMEDLKNAVDEIAKGNYNVKVDCEVTNEFGVLIHSFNEMARRLQESEKMKLAYEENRKTLIANISHDLKTPIAAIQGYIEAIADGVVTSPEKVNKYLKIIYHNTNYMNKLIDDLFLFSKLDMDKLDFQYEEILMRPFIEDIMEEFKLELEENQLRFDYIDRLEQDCYVNVDRKRIHQAIRNIIGNAVKYGAEKDLLIQTKMYRSDDFLCLAIQDNGPGIPKDKLPYVFDRFYRIDIERTKDFMSTGLGLAIAKELVEAHKGRITVASVEKEGTCFTIMLPIIKQ